MNICSSNTIIRYLDAAQTDAQDRAKHLVPEIGDVKAHPLPAIQDLIAEPYTTRTLKDVTNEISDYLEHEMRYAKLGRLRGLEEFITWYQGIFLDTLRILIQKKIATCDALGMANAKDKLINVLASLPQFPSLEIYEDFCRRILKAKNTGPTDKIVIAWRKHKSAPFPAPEEFEICFRRALKLDAEATDEINNAPASPSPITAKKSEREEIISLVYEIYTSTEWQRRKIKGDKRPKDMSYTRAIRIMLDEPIPQDDPFYERTKEARAIVKKMAKGENDAKIRSSLKTQVINYAKRIKPNTSKTLTINQAVSRLSPSDKTTVRDALDRYGENHYDHDSYMGAYPTIGDSSAYR